LHCAQRHFNGRVFAPGVVQQCVIANCRVEIGGVAGKQRCQADGRVVGTSGVMKKRLLANRCVAVAMSVLQKRLPTNRSVALAVGVGEQRLVTESSVQSSGRSIGKSLEADGGAEARFRPRQSRGKAGKCLIADSSVCTR